MAKSQPKVTNVPTFRIARVTKSYVVVQPTDVDFGGMHVTAEMAGTMFGRKSDEFAIGDVCTATGWQRTKDGTGE